MTEEKFALTTSRGFTDWLSATNGSVAITTYQAGKIILFGLKPEGRLSIFERTFRRAMGLAVNGNGRMLVLATHFQLYRFDNLLPSGRRQDLYDAVYAPNKSWITGDLDIHDVAIGSDDRTFFANTLFNCVATVADGFNFRPVCRPSFISKLAAEDRCHLNGLAMQAGQPKFVTCVSKSNVSDGWRDRRLDGGIVIDVPSNEIVAHGLSMPHSPRLYGGKLWLLNSGTGEFGWLDTNSGAFDAVAFCPGYARGLSFVDKYAVIGLSHARQNRTFGGLALEEALSSRDADARCGLLIVDIETGNVVEWMRIEGVVKELFDVVILPNIGCPSMVGLKGPEITRTISIDGV